MSKILKLASGGRGGLIDRRTMLKLSAAGLAAPAILGLSDTAWAQAKKSLRMLTEDTDDVEVAWYKQVNALFEKAHPDTTVQYDAIGMSGLFQKITTLLSANDSPDMVPGSGLSRVATLANLKVLGPVDDIVETIGRDDYVPGILDQFTFEGKLLAVPYQALAYVLWYRKDLAAQANAKPPTTWDELLAFAKALTRDGVYGIVLSAGVNTETARRVFTFLRQNGGNVVDENLKVALDSAKNRETLHFMKELYQYSPPGTANYNSADLLNNFTAGTAASAYYPGRMLQRVSTKTPAIADQMGSVRQPFKTTQFCYGEPRGAYIFNTARNRDAAKAWMLEHQFESGQHIDWLLTAPGHNLPLRKSIAADPRFKDNPFLKKHAEAVNLLQAEIVTSGNFYRESPNHKPNPQSGQLDSGPILPTMFQRFLVNNESAESVLAWAHKQVTDLMNS